MLRTSFKRWVALCGLAGLGAVAAHAAPVEPWVGTWSAAPDSTLPTLAGHSVREAIRTSAGGSQLRLTLSNANGTGPVTLGPVHVAKRADGAAIVAGSDHAVLFHGKPSVTLAKGETVTSDPVPMAVSPLQALAVSIHVGDGAGASTAHGVGNQMAWIAQGDTTGAAAFPAREQVSSRLFLVGVDVAPTAPGYAIVALGDSITDGVGSTPDTDARWPDDLAARLQQQPGMAGVGVLDQGIAGNRLLHGEHLPFLAPSALTRLDTDVLDKPGVRYVVVLEGINDISAGSYFPGTADDVSAQQIIDGMKSLIARAHARKVKVIGATLLPFEGLEWPFHSADGEAKRQAVNAWIRSGGAFDAVVDTDKALRDPAHPERLLARYDSGDHLHPNDAGHKAIAAAFDIPALFATR